MSKAKKGLPPEVTKDKVDQGTGPIVTNLNILAVQRTMRTIADWRAAHITAASPYYSNRTRLLDLYEDVRLDGHLKGIMQKRISSVLNKTLHYTVNGKKVDEMDEVINSTEFRGIISHYIKSKYFGVGGLEFQNGSKICYDVIPNKHIKLEYGIIAIEQSMTTGYEYDKLPNVLIFGDKSELGLLLECAPYAIYKRGNFGDWAQYIEKYGQPFMVAKYDAYDIKSKKAVNEAMAVAGGSVGISLPKQADFELLDGKHTNADGKLQDTFKKACNDEMSVIILGNTDTTTASAGSGYAQAKEHGEQQIEITKDDMIDCANFLSSEKVYNILKSYNLPVQPNGRFEYEKEINLNALKTRKDIDIALSNVVPIEDDYFYNTYGLPKPANYKELRAKMDEEKAAKIDPARPAKPPKNKQKPAKLSKLSFLQSLREAGLKKTIKQALSDFFEYALPGA